MQTSFRIGRFTVTRSGNTVVMAPGFLKIKNTRGVWVYCKECVVNAGDSFCAGYEFERFCRIAKQEYTVDMWERLNAARHAVYVRFQKFVARNHGGKWLRGIVISEGKVNFNFE